MSNIIKFKHVKFFDSSSDPEFLTTVLSTFFGVSIVTAPSEIKEDLKHGGYTLLISESKSADAYINNAVRIWKRHCSSVVFSREIYALASFMDCVIESRDVYGLDVQFDPSRHYVCYACELYMNETSCDKDRFDDHSCPICGDPAHEGSTVQFNINTWSFHAPSIEP